MILPWTDPRCIICLEQSELTLEHIIPKLIGGRLQSGFLCKSCNNTLGMNIDSRLKGDPQVRSAGLGLRDSLPGLVEAIENAAITLGLGCNHQKGYTRDLTAHARRRLDVFGELAR